MGSNPAFADNALGGGGNSNMGSWMDMARGYGWINNQLTGTWKPNGAKNGRVRTGLGTFRSNLNNTPTTEPVIEPVAKPVAKPVAPSHEAAPNKEGKSRFAWLKLSGKKKTSTGAKPAGKVRTSSSNKPGAVHTPRELKNLKPPPGVRAIRRVPTRVHR